MLTSKPRLQLKICHAAFHPLLSILPLNHLKKGKFAISGLHPLSQMRRRDAEKHSRADATGVAHLNICNLPTNSPQILRAMCVTRQVTFHLCALNPLTHLCFNKIRQLQLFNLLLFPQSSTCRTEQLAHLSKQRTSQHQCT